MGGETGRDVMRKYVGRIPESPGIYKMINIDGVVIYVGKANNLKSRVSYYTNKNHDNYKTELMISQVAKVAFVVTRTEDEALFLEAKLIYTMKPKYNILLKDDRTHPFIVIDLNSSFPRISITRGNSIRRSSKVRLFGPFSTKYEAMQLVVVIQKVCQIRICSDIFFKARSRPCVEYQIKRCSAPCVGYVDSDQYGQQVSCAVRLLCGDIDSIVKHLNDYMYECSESEDYDRAIIIRDRISALEKLRRYNTFNVCDSGDYVGFCNLLDVCCVQVFRVVDNHHYGNVGYTFENTNNRDDGYILSTFITRHYIVKDMDPPPKIFVAHDVSDKEVLERVLFNKYGTPVPIVVTKKSSHLEFIKNISLNAEYSVIDKVEKRFLNIDLMNRVAAIFSIGGELRNIEVIDNSHTSGGSPVGVIVAVDVDGFVKSKYRVFHIMSQNLSDDYGMLSEVLVRRLKYGNYPDLFLIDGGRGHLNTAVRVLKDHGVSVPCVGIAKGRQRRASKEKFYVPGRVAFSIKDDNAVFRYLQRLRDEAHRFAITSHRRKRIRDL